MNIANVESLGQLGKVDSVNFNRFGQNPVNSVNFNRFFVAQKRAWIVTATNYFSWKMKSA